MSDSQLQLAGARGPLKECFADACQYTTSSTASNSMDQKTSSLGGMLKTITMNAVQRMAMQLIIGAQRPRFHGATAGVTYSPELRRLLRQLR